MKSIESREGGIPDMGGTESGLEFSHDAEKIRIGNLFEPQIQAIDKSIETLFGSEAEYERVLARAIASQRALKPIESLALHLRDQRARVEESRASELAQVELERHNGNGNKPEKVE